VVEGISYVTNYRNQYASEFRAKGVEKVIEELQATDS
jgi:ABC-type transporter MlaC component